MAISYFTTPTKVAISYIIVMIRKRPKIITIRAVITIESIMISTSLLVTRLIIVISICNRIVLRL